MEIKIMCFCITDWAMFWNSITAISTAGLFLLTLFIVWYASKQLRASRNIASADFISRFKNDFFTEPTRQLLLLFEYNLLNLKEEKIDNDPFYYFEIDTEKLDKNSSLKEFIKLNGKLRYSHYEIENFLLDHFEDLGLYLENKVIEIDFVYEGFSSFIKLIFNNPQINKYIETIRAVDEDQDCYDKFEGVYNAVLAHERDKLSQ